MHEECSQKHQPKADGSHQNEREAVGVVRDLVRQIQNRLQQVDCAHNHLQKFSDHNLSPIAARHYSSSLATGVPTVQHSQNFQRWHLPHSLFA
jgi:hypothetical protein